MEKISKLIKNLKKSSIKRVVDQRLEEFKKTGKASSDRIFSELCFCLLTANFNAERSILIQKEIGNGFLFLSEDALAEKLKGLGYRYPNARAKYIVEARKHKGSLRNILESSNDEIELRQWLVSNVKGLGYKEASHFLRNIGYKNLAIVDFHIIDLLEKHGLVNHGKRTLSRKKYIEIENILRELSRKMKTNLAELDLYLWYLETGRVLK